MENDKSNIKKLHVLSSEDKQFSFTLPLKQHIRIGKHDYEVKLKVDEKLGTYILWKNRKYPVEIVKSRQNRYEILFNDVSYSFTVETPFSLQRKKALQSSKDKTKTEMIKAPMPGKIIEVLAREGVSIQRGEGVVVLEAMKMQNVILSTINGTVTRIAVKPNSNVMKDDLIAEIKQ